MTDRQLDDLYNLCYSCIIDGGNDGEPMSYEDAEITLENWFEEGDEEIVSIIRGVDYRDFAKIYNNVLKQIHKKHC